MSVLDWLFIGLLSSAILFLLFMVLVSVGALLTGRNLKKLKQRKVKNKKKRKKLKRAIRQMQEKRKQQWINVILLLVLSIGLGGGAIYTRHYQGTTLGERDSDALTQGYYLVDEIKAQLEGAESAESKTKVANNIKELSGRLSSYGTRVASQRLTLKNQSMLNKQYNYMMELGVNLNAQTEEFLNDPEKLAEFEADLEKVRAHQQQVLKQLKISEDSLKKKDR